MHGCNSVTEEQLRSLPLTSEGVTYVVTVSESDPARALSHGPRRNLVGEVPLIENNVSLQQEAVSGECLCLVELQLRREPRGAYVQPLSVQLQISDRANRFRRKTHAPDYLVVDTKGVTVYETRDAAELDCLRATRTAPQRIEEKTQ